jgi:hypothetical protein
MPAVLEGLKAGYEITGASEKEVGDKGNFSRYKIRFFVVNTSNEAKLIINKPNNLFGGNASPELVKFRCTNATGMRLTSKEASLSAKPCIIDALVDETDPATGKAVQKKKPANIGYWIRPGESISTNTIMIVPLNERPAMLVSFFPNTTGMPAAIVNDNNGMGPGGSRPTVSFVRLKNFANSTYLHNQDGPLNCSKIDFNWWSAQWEIIPVTGTSNFQIRNRWKNNFISTENGNLLSDNGQSAKAMWQIEETGTGSVYYIRNVADNSRLVLQNGQLRSSSGFNSNDAAAQWIIER